MSRTPLIALALLPALLVAACKTNDDSDTDAPDTGDPAETVCGQASERTGELVCLQRLADAVDLERVAAPSDDIDVLIASRYLVPRSVTAPLPTVFANTKIYTDGASFLADGFPDDYAGTDEDGFAALTTGPDRDYASGSLGIWLSEDGDSDFLGFTVDETTPVTMDEVADTWRSLRDQVAFQVPIFVPTGDQVERSLDWEGAPFPIAGPALPDFEVYHPAEALGVVRLFTEAELEQAELDGLIGPEDLVVVDDAPFSVDRVVGAVVSQSPSPRLAPANLRAAAHGVPACTIRSASVDLADLDGTPVRLSCDDSGWSVTEVTLAEVDTHLAERRPTPTPLPPPDLVDTALIDLQDLPVSTLEERETARSRYGAQATDLAIARSILGIGSSLRSFAVPVAWYDDFLQRNTFPAEIDGQFLVVSYAEAIDAWLADPDFQDDPTVRATRLRSLSIAMTAGTLAPELTVALADQATATLGGSGITARVRSSGTADGRLGLASDDLDTASSACVADDLDDDLIGPSICDDGEPDEQTAAEAVSEVYAQMWSPEAADARDWYGIPFGAVGSGVLVVERVSDERAEIRAFTTDPLTGGNRMLVHAQIGGEPPVDPDVVDRAEVATLAVQADAVDIRRLQSSTDVEPGVQILTDAELTLLAERLTELSDAFPADAVPAGLTQHLDTRWKVLSDGRLALSAVKPFYR